MNSDGISKRDVPVWYRPVLFYIIIACAALGYGWILISNPMDIDLRPDLVGLLMGMALGILSAMIVRLSMIAYYTERVLYLRARRLEPVSIPTQIRRMFRARGTYRLVSRLCVVVSAVLIGARTFYQYDLPLVLQSADPSPTAVSTETGTDPLASACLVYLLALLITEAVYMILWYNRLPDEVEVLHGSINTTRL